MAGLTCENEFCIYQRYGNCALNNIQLDVQGSCMSCIYINIEEKDLNELKERFLERL